MKSRALYLTPDEIMDLIHRALQREDQSEQATRLNALDPHHIVPSDARTLAIRWECQRARTSLLSSLLDEIELADKLKIAAEQEQIEMTHTPAVLALFSEIRYANSSGRLFRIRGQYHYDSIQSELNKLSHLKIIQYTADTVGYGWKVVCPTTIQAFLRSLEANPEAAITFPAPADPWSQT